MPWCADEARPHVREMGHGRSFPLSTYRKGFIKKLSGGVFHIGSSMEKYRVELTESERGELLGVVAKGKAAAATITHDNVLLAVDSGEHAELRMASARAAAAYHVSERTAGNVKRKLAEEGMDAALSRAARGGYSDGFTQICASGRCCSTPRTGTAW